MLVAAEPRVRLCHEMNVWSSMVRFLGLRVGIVAAVGTAGLVAACTKAPKGEPSARAPATKPTTGSTGALAVSTFDGLSIGGSFARSRAPYDHPCDSDPLDTEPNIKVMFYTGKECRGHQFPDGTSVIVLVDSASSEISALAWVGGSYFDSRGAPLKTGTPVGEAVKAWGQPSAKFDLQTAHVARFANGTRVLSNRNDQVIGFAFGEWPDANGPRWNPVDQVNARYTTPVLSAAVSAADCQAAMAHVYELMGSNKSVSQLDIDDCRGNNTPENVKCIIAAKNNDEVVECYSGR